MSHPRPHSALHLASLLSLALAGSVFAADARAADPPPPAPPAPSTPPPPALVPPVSAPPAAAAPAAAEVMAPTRAEAQYRRIPVDVASTRPDAVIERRVTTNESLGAFLIFPYRNSESTWEQVCISPCRGVELDRYSTYRVAAANGISSSSPFTLPQGDSTVHLQVDAGDRVAHRIGGSLIGVGTVAAIIGASLVVAAGNVKNHDNEVHTRDAGWITGGAGLVALGIGIPLLLLTRTTVTADDHPLRAADTRPRFTGNGFVF